jgi:transcriptional regulator with XRE-family HTH domain
MTRREPPIHAFRRRLLQLIDERFDGRYTALARRAGIPVSTMQHYVHAAKHLPGGEHLMRMAAALGVAVEGLVGGPEAGRPAARPTHRAPVVFTRAQTPPPGIATHVSLPVFRCGCPGPCPLTEVVPPVAAMQSKLVLAAALLARSGDHRLLAIEVDAQLPCAEWPLGAVLALDWDARTPRWEALMLLHDHGHCRLGHVTPSGDRLLVTPRRDGTPDLVSPEGRILGTIVAGVTAL